MLLRGDSSDSMFSSIRGAPASVGTFGLLPSPAAAKNYISSLADAYDLSRELVHAVAQTASGFDTEKVTAQPGSSSEAFAPDNQAYGVMQVRGDQIGKTVRASDGTTCQIGDNVRPDWRANAQAGVALLAQHYRLAALENPFGSEQEHAQQAYAGYSAGSSLRDRYLLTRSDGQPAHPDDRAFLLNFSRAAASPDEQTPSRSPAGAQTQAQPNSSVPSSDEAASEPLPGPLQRLKENPGDLFLRPADSSDPKNPSGPVFRGIDLVPSLSNLPQRSRSLAHVLAPLLSPQQPSARPPLPPPIQRLKENPGNLLVPRSGFSDASQRAIEMAAQNGYIPRSADFKATILQAAAQNHISPNLLVGLAERESSIDPDRVNEIGAKGLYQLLPARQKDLGITGDDVFDYKVVIPKVAQALRQALDR